MKSPLLSSRLYSASAWATFTLGATQLALILGGTVPSVIAILCCAGLFALSLFSETGRDKVSRVQFAKFYLFPAGLLLAFTPVYSYMVFVTTNVTVLVYLSTSVLLFLVPLPIAILFIRKSANGAV